MPDITSHPTPSLDQRPEARGFRVEQLLDQAQRGTLRIPHFQRPLRWKTKNVLELFDSIRRGFPIGALLLSRGPAEEGTVTFGPVSFSVPDHHAALWVVDGQQRLTALVATLLRRESTPRRDFWAVWFDLENQTFEVLTRREPEPTWIPLNVLSDSVRQLKWIRTWPYAESREDLVNRALEVGKSIREYEVPAYIVENANDDVLRLIFTRANTGGSPMRESEIFEALHSSEGEQPIRSAVSRLMDLGFGRLDEDLFLRCLRYTCNPMLSEHVTPASQLPVNAIQKTEAAVRRAIVTITTWAGIPVFKLMPYRLPLYVLAAFYDQFPEENTRADRLAAHWLWRGALSARHVDSSDATVARLVAYVRAGDDPEVTMAGLIEMLGSIDTAECFLTLDEQLSKKVSLGSAKSKLFILALLAAEPRFTNSFRTDMQPTLFSDEEFDDEDADNADAESNTVLHKKPYCSVLNENSQNLGIDVVVRLDGMSSRFLDRSSDYELSSFLLSEDCVRHALSGEDEAFRTCRRGIIEPWLRQFVADRTGSRVDTRPSVVSILNSGISAAVEG